MDAITLAKQKAARRRIQNFKQQYGPPHYHLACHAALPVAFTPDMLYCIWANFPTSAPWFAVADLTLSRLCTEVSYELYEIDTEVRELLLEDLQESFGQAQLHALAGFLIAYADQEARTNLDEDIQDLAEAQRWVALAYTNPAKVAQELKTALQQGDERTQWRVLNLQGVFPPAIRDLLAEWKSEADTLSEAMDRKEKLVEEGEITPFESTGSEFVVGGTVQAKKNGIYIKRPADDELFTACMKGDSVTIFAARQTGKSSLMLATSEKLKVAGIKTILIELNTLGIVDTAEPWYYNFMREVSRRGELNVDMVTWWKEQSNLTNSRRLIDFIETVLLVEIQSPVVIFIDEIDTIIGTSYKDSFFSAIRSCINNPTYDRLSFVLLGVADPNELISDPRVSPFNVARHIELTDFTPAECKPIIDTLSLKYPQQGERYFERIYHWTNGHPYLIQKLSQAVFEADDNSLDIDALIQELFGVSPHVDSNIAYIADRMSRHFVTDDMLSLYTSILNGEPVNASPQASAMRPLLLSGLVVRQEGRLQVRNRIYETVFDEAWIEGLWKENPEFFDIVLHYSRHDETELQEIIYALKIEKIEFKSIRSETVSRYSIKTVLENSLSQTKTLAVFVGPIPDDIQYKTGEFVDLDNTLTKASKEGLTVLSVLLPGINNIPSNISVLNSFKTINLNSINDKQELKSLIKFIKKERESLFERFPLQTLIDLINKVFPPPELLFITYDLYIDVYDMERTGPELARLFLEYVRDNSLEEELLQLIAAHNSTIYDILK